MTLPRRRFLKAVVVSTVSAGFAANTVQMVFGQKSTRGRVNVITESDLQLPAEAQRDAILLFTRVTFDPYLGGIFQAPNARGEMVELKLVSIRTFKPTQAVAMLKTKARNSDSFTLTFSATEPLPEFTSIHNVSHPALGNFSLFLTPRTDSDGQLFYEAVFNHAR